MPLTLTTHVSRTPRVRSHQRPDLAYRLLHQIADAVAPELHTLWSAVFAEVRDAIPEGALRDALASGNPVLVEEVLAPLWHRLGEAQAQRILPELVRETVQRAAEVMIPSTAATLGVTIDASFNVVVPETLALINQYVGTQIRGITDLTLQNVRAVIRTGFSEGRGLTQMMHDLEGFIGLTPRQTLAIERLRERLTSEGLSRAQIQQRVQEASARALRLRVEAIARTESMAMANMGNHALLVQSVEQGLVSETGIRRHWLVASDERLCFRCAPRFNRRL